MAFPPLILVMAIVATFGGEHISSSPPSLSIIPDATRIVRATSLGPTDSLRRCGHRDGSHKRIILRHMLPNVMATYLIAAGRSVAPSRKPPFLGLGVSEPIPAWGLMLREDGRSITGVYWTSVFPGLAIALAVFGFFVFGDALRDVLDPRLRRG